MQLFLYALQCQKTFAECPFGTGKSNMEKPKTHYTGKKKKKIYFESKILQKKKGNFSTLMLRWKFLNKTKTQTILRMPIPLIQLLIQMNQKRINK